MSAMTLHAAADAVRDLLDQMDIETGELPPEFDQARAVVATKAAAVTAYIVETERQAGMLEDYAHDLSLRVKAARKRVEWLKGYLAAHMAVCGITSIKDERGVFRADLYLGRDEAVDVFDASQVPPAYLREIPARREPDKGLLKRAIKDGFEVPGARIVKRDRLTIR